MSIVPTFRLDGQAAIVTGASSGLGVIIAHALAEQGCSLVLAARRHDRLTEVADDICRSGGTAVAVTCDVAEPDHADRLVARCRAEFGRLDGIVANAGVPGGGPAAHESPSAFASVLNVNVTAVAALAAAAARHMIDANGGWMIFQSSILGRRAGTGPGVAAYTSSKGAIEQLTRELARQWAPHSIRVNALAPGYFPTEMNAAMVSGPGRLASLVARIPLGHPGTPEDLAGVVAFLASDAARYVTGQVLGVDGGMSAW